MVVVPGAWGLLLCGGFVGGGRVGPSTALEGGWFFFQAAWTLQEAAASLSSSRFRAWEGAGCLSLVCLALRFCGLVVCMRWGAWVLCCCCLCSGVLGSPWPLVGCLWTALCGCCSGFCCGSGLLPRPLWVCSYRPLVGPDRPQHVTAAALNGL